MVCDSAVKRARHTDTQCENFRPSLEGQLFNSSVTCWEKYKNKNKNLKEEVGHSDARAYRLYKHGEQV